ncbi:hypothetical protein [Alteromonas macleodii]|uniref:hypothetical protein n=1 Tax=Alteromonas macleodii TaxID=28108 RepID=UPI003140AC91|tara:strand:- start:919 stop:1128 length:210 start_codon:yes stop_codon:yes gene_type:complete
MISKLFFSSVLAFMSGLVFIGAASCFFLFGLLELDYNNPMYGLVGGAIGSVYYSWYRTKQTSLNAPKEK